MGRTYSLFQVQILMVKQETLPNKMIYGGLLLKIGEKEQSYNDYLEKLGCWILRKMHLFWRITLQQTSSSRTSGIKKTIHKVEKMFESHDHNKIQLVSSGDVMRCKDELTEAISLVWLWCAVGQYIINKP